MNSLLVPLRFKHGKKWFSISKNQYKDMHYRTKPTLKIFIFNYVKMQIKPSIKMVDHPVIVHTKVHLPGDRRYDVFNWTDIAKIYVIDALVEYGVIADDDRKSVVGGYDTEAIPCNFNIPVSETYLTDRDGIQLDLFYHPRGLLEQISAINRINTRNVSKRKK